MSAARILILAAVIAGAMPLRAAHAQPVPAPPPVDQLRRPSEVPLPTPAPPQPAPPLRAPEQPPAPAGSSLSEGIRFQARGFRFVGNTVVADADLQAIAAPFVGRSIGNSELDELRTLLTRRYIDAGYINSGAVLPDQDVAGGIVTYRIVEGRLTEIAVGGPHRYDPQFLGERLRIGAAGVLDINRLQERLQVLLQDPLIERISAELAPGGAPGEAILRADVASAPLFVAGLTLSNERSPLVGAEQAEVHFALRNLLGRGDILALRPAYTEGVRDLAVAFSLPLLPSGTTLNLRGQRTRSRIVESPLDQLDISARSRSLELGLSQPLLTNLRQSLQLNGWLVRRDTRNFFLGEPSDLVPGAPDGRVRLSLIRIGLDGVDRSPERVLAGRLQVSHGIDAFGATVADGAPDSRFTTLLAQAQWVQRVPALGGYAILRLDAQRANDTLPSAERYSLGGADTVRGYRKDLLVRDNGWLASIEYRHVLGYLPWSGNGSGDGALLAAVFFDTGRAWNRDDPASATRIAAIGPGLRWEPVPGAELQVYYGKALKRVDTPTRTTQDRGVHFRIGFSRSF